MEIQSCDHFTELESPYPCSVPHGSPLTLWTSSKHNNQGPYTARGKTDTTWSLFFSLVLLFSPIVSLSLSPAGTSNQIKTGWRGRELQLWSPACPPIGERDRRREFIATPSPPLLLVIPSRNRREEERAASVAQRRYNNRKKTNQPVTPKPFHNLGYGEAFGTNDKTGVCMHLCAWTAHHFHSWVTDGALSLARISRAAHIPRHAGNAFCDVQLMLT